MHDYFLEFDDEHGEPRSIPFSALSPSGAFKHALKVVPGRWATLRDTKGEICRIERMSRAEVWRIVQPA